MASENRRVAVAAEHDGLRLDNFLTASLPDLSRSQVQRLIRDGHVRGPGSAVRASTAVRAGQSFDVDVPEPTAATPKPEPLVLPILYEDSDLVVLDKPAGMVVHP